MGASELLDLGREALMLTLIVAAPVLLAGLAVGLLVSIVQAITQVHEQTLSLVPRMAAMLAALLAFGPWIVGRLVEFGAQMFGPP